MGALQEIIQSKGHILLLSPKCHPEVAGCGIEYSWGKSKMAFRRNFNDCAGKNLQDNIVKSLATVTMDIVWKFERKTRDY